jgi:hypothetical protein
MSLGWLDARVAMDWVVIFVGGCVVIGQPKDSFVNYRRKIQRGFVEFGDWILIEHTGPNVTLWRISSQWSFDVLL